MRILRYLFLASAVVFILLQIIYYPQMPNTVAIHFNSNGQVNGWMSRDLNFIMSCVIIIIITLSFVGVPYIAKSVSDDLINVPHKEYWLSANNKERLIEIISTYLYSIGLVTNIFMIFLFHQLYKYNIHAINEVSIIALVPFLIIILGFTIHLIIRLNKCT
jgi:uncharacterized membrane protein